MSVATLSDAIGLLRRLFPEATDHGESPEAPPQGLPPPLVELYAELGGAIGRPMGGRSLTVRGTRSSRRDNTHFLQSQDSLLPMSRLRQDEIGRWIIAVENQGSWDWRVATASGDSPVFSACADDDLAQLREVNPLLSEFLQGFLLREAIFGSTFGTVVDDFDGIAGLRPLKLECRVVSAASNFYLSADAQALVNNEAGAWWFGSNTAAPLLRLGLTLT